MTAANGRRRPYGGRSTLIAIASTVVFVVAVGLVVGGSPSWPLVQHDFFDPTTFWRYLPVIARAFVLNIALFLVVEVLVLILGLVVAIVRNLPGPVFFPLRLVAILFADIFRGVPSLLVIYLLGFGIPGLQLPGVPSEPFLWAAVALTLVYTAYVSEVYRAGIESIHPSQAAAARSLGLTRLQALRFVVIPQAIRRVIPPLLNDFIGLQKDTVLVSYIGLVEAFRTANVEQQAHFNYTPYLVAAFFFVLITIPLARFTDWLIERERRRRRRIIIIVVALIVLLIMLIVRYLNRTNPPGQGQWPGHAAPPPASPVRPEALDILRERFARGEITLDEFETAKRALGYSNSSAPPPSDPGTPPTG